MIGNPQAAMFEGFLFLVLSLLRTLDAKDENHLKVYFPFVSFLLLFNILYIYAKHYLP